MRLFVKWLFCGCPHQQSFLGSKYSSGIGISLLVGLFQQGFLLNHLLFPNSEY